MNVMSDWIESVIELDHTALALNVFTISSLQPE